jgi:hypothetical protein
MANPSASTRCSSNSLNTLLEHSLNPHAACLRTRVQVCIPANAEAPDAATGADAMRTVALDSVRRLEHFSSDGAGVGALLVAGPVLIAVSDVGQVVARPCLLATLSSQPFTPSIHTAHTRSTRSHQPHSPLA